MLKIYLVLCIMLVPASNAYGRAADVVAYEQARMTFESTWRVEEIGVTCLEEETIPTWNGAEMDGYLLDGVYYRRVKEGI